MHVYNLGTDESIVVDESIGVICGHLGIAPVLEHTGGTRGWAGDSPLIHLDTTKIRALGWEPTVGIRDAVDQDARVARGATRPIVKDVR